MYLGSIRSGALAVLAMAGVLGGCADTGWDTSSLFRKPIDVVGRTSGYTYSDLQQSRQDRPVADSDLVDANGSCPAAAAPGSDASGLGEGVGLGMTECEVVARAGPPNSAQLGRNPNGDRTAVLNYQSGPRPGIYHFERGRLMQMDRVEVAPPPQKKPAKTKKPPAANHAA